MPFLFHAGIPPSNKGKKHIKMVGPLRITVERGGKKTGFLAKASVLNSRHLYYEASGTLHVL